MMKKIIAALAVLAVIPSAAVSAGAGIENLSVKQNGSRIEISGNISDMQVPVVQYTIAGPGISSVSETTVMDAAVLSGQEDAKENGEFEFSVTIGNRVESGEYTVILNTFKGGAAAKKSFSYLSDRERDGILRIFNSKDVSAIYNAVEDAENKELIESFGISMDSYAAMPEEEKKFICSLVAQYYPEQAPYTIESFGRAFKISETYTRIINVEAKEAYSLLSENADILGIDTSDMAEDDLILRFIRQAPVSEGIAGFAEAFNNGKAVSAVNRTLSYMDIYSVLEKYNSIFGINFKAYSSLSRSAQSDVCRRMIGTYQTPAGVKEKFDEAVKAASKTAQSGSSGGGGGGGASASGGSVGFNTVAVGSKPVSDFGSESTHAEVQNSTAAPAEIFADIDNVPWAKNAIEVLAKKGVINGTGNGSFEPDRSITRAEFIKLAVLAFNIPTEGKTCSYRDVDEKDWFYSYAAAATEAGIINGYEDNRFGPDDTIIRQDIAVIAYRAAVYAGKAPAQGVGSGFADSADIAEYAADAVAALHGAGIIDGMEDGRFAPAGRATRAQAAKIIYMLTAE